MMLFDNDKDVDNTSPPLSQTPKNKSGSSDFTKISHFF